MTQKETTAQTTISQILDGFRKFNEAQEASRAQEQQHWQSERQGFLKRIKELEDTIVALATSTYNNTAIIGDTTDSPSRLNQESSAAMATARAVWNPESIPTRTFSEAAVHPTNTVNQTKNPEEVGERKKSVGFDLFSKPSTTRHTSLAGVDGELVHPDYSGITVRPSALPPHLRQKVENASARASSLHKTGAVDNSRPQTVIRPKLLDIPTANMRSEELYSIDAGHTPLARVTGSEGTTGTLTPMPHSSQVPVEDSVTTSDPRLPSERQDSYFANAQVEDPALKEPLGVSSDNNTTQDTDFLEQVNQSLERQLSRQLDDAGLSPPTEKGHRRVVSEADDGGPKLKLKQSINFGAPFGQSEPTRT